MRVKVTEIYSFVDSFIKERILHDARIDLMKNRIKALVYILVTPDCRNPEYLEDNGIAVYEDIKKIYGAVYEDVKKIYGSKEYPYFNKCVKDCLKRISKEFKNGYLLRESGEYTIKDIIKESFRILASL